MTKQQASINGLEQSTNNIQETLQEAIGPHLLTLYRFDNPTIDGIDFLAVIGTHNNLHPIREQLRQHIEAIQQWPYIATPTALKRHLQLDAKFAQQLNNSGQLIFGQEISVKPTNISIQEEIGLLAGIAIEVSSILAPQLLKVGEFETALQKLENLTLYLGISTNNNANNAIESLAALQGYLAKLVAGHEESHWQIPAPTGAPPLIDALVAIYEWQDRVIFVLPDWQPETIEAYINQVDWTAVSDSLAGQYRGLQITTPSQFRLMLEYDKTADYYFKNYTHAWGINALASLEVPRGRIHRNLACIASRYEIHSFTHAYLSATDDQLNGLIHDYQNTLLNIQLREELMHRLFGLERAMPAKPLPSREAPTKQKIAAIFEQFARWADHYTKLMNQA